MVISSTYCRLVSLAPWDHMIVACPCDGVSLVLWSNGPSRPPSLALDDRGCALLPTLLALLNRTLPVLKERRCSALTWQSSQFSPVSHILS